MRYATDGRGEVLLRALAGAGPAGIEIVVRDDGPGIADVEQALQQGYTSGRGLGMGLPGTRRLMDEMTIDSAVGRGHDRDDPQVAALAWGRRPPEVAIAHRGDVEAARRAARALAVAQRLPPGGGRDGRPGHVELATNLVRHARQGRLRLAPLDAAAARGD